MKTTITAGDVAAELLRGQVDAELLEPLKGKGLVLFQQSPLSERGYPGQMSTWESEGGYPGREDTWEPVNRLPISPIVVEGVTFILDEK